MNAVCESCKLIIPWSATRGSKLSAVCCPRCQGGLRTLVLNDWDNPALTRIGEAAVDAPRRELYKHIAAPDGPRIEYKHIPDDGGRTPLKEDAE